MLRTEIVSCQTSEFKNFCIREYVAAIRERDPATCWPFESVCEFKDLDTQDMAPDSQLRESLSLSSLKITEDTNAPELPKVQNSKGKEVESEAPTAFELEWTMENNTGSEIATATALLEFSKGNKTQLDTATASELEIPKGKKTQSENASAFELEWSKGIDTGYETDTATEVITSKEVNDGMDEIISDGNTELVNLSESENEEIVNGYGGTKTEISIVISDDANSGKTSSKPPKKRKFRVLSELLMDLEGPNIESTIHYADKVDENTDKSDEDFTIDDDDDDEDDSDDDTLGIFQKKRKNVKITSRNYNNKKKKTRAPKPKPKCKPSNRGSKGSKVARRTKRAKPHPLDRKLTHAVEANKVALAAKRKRCGSYDDRRGGTQPVVGVGGSKDPGPGRGLVTGSKRWTLVCVLNRNPADFTIVGPGNKYMRRF